MSQLTTPNLDQIRLAQQRLQSLELYTSNTDDDWGPLSNIGAAVANEWARFSDALTVTINLSDEQKSDMDDFLKILADNQDRYKAVSAQTGIPADLIAAIHYREGSGNFATYLQNGDPLGKPTVHDPKGLLFNAWEPAAVDALNREKSALLISSIKNHPNVLAAQLSYAETYNGRGYFKMGKPSPYVWAGTSKYVSGKYTDDGKYSPDTVDTQLGVLPMLRTCRHLD